PGQGGDGPLVEAGDGTVDQGDFGGGWLQLYLEIPVVLAVEDLLPLRVRPEEDDIPLLHGGAFLIDHAALDGHRIVVRTRRPPRDDECKEGGTAKKEQHGETELTA